MTDPIPTHAYTYATTIPFPQIASNVTLKTVITEIPLEGEVGDGDATTVLVYASNFHPAYNETEFVAETTHVVGLRFDSSGVLVGHTTLDGRGVIMEPSVNSDSGGLATVFALGDDCYLISRRAGRTVFSWTPTTISWVVQVDDLGVPQIVDTYYEFAPGYYNKWRNEIIYINPTTSWLDDHDWIGTGALPGALEDPDVHGCFGVAVSTAGFGDKTKYADPPNTHLTTGNPALAFPAPGVAFSAGVIFADWRTSTDFEYGSYTIDTGVVDHIPALTEVLESASAGQKGDCYTPSPSPLHGYSAGDQLIEVSDGVSLAGPWTFRVADPDLQDSLVFQARSFAGDQQIRLGLFNRFPSASGFWVGFQPYEGSTQTMWGVFEDSDLWSFLDRPVERVIARNGNTYWTVSNPNSFKEVMILRWEADAGRLKVLVSAEEDPVDVWKFASPYIGENGGFGKLKIKVDETGDPDVDWVLAGW